MRLGTRIVVLAVCLVGVANFLSLCVVALSLRSSLVAQLQADVTQAERAIQERLDAEAVSLRATAVVIATSGDIYSPVGTANIDANWEAFGVDLLAVRSPAGRVQVWGAKNAPQATPGADPMAVEVEGRTIYLVSASTRGGGAVSVGRSIDDAWVQAVAAVTSTEVVMAQGGRVVASATRSVGAETLVEVPDGMHAATLDSAPLVMTTLSLPGEGARMVVAINEADAFGRYHRTMSGLVIVGVLTVLGAAAAAISLAGWLVAPIRQVTSEAERIARVALSSHIDSEDSDVILPNNSLLEAARMAESLRTIINELRESKALLETELRAKHDALQVAKRAEAAKQQFLANMSHELRTPLNAIIGYTEMIREECNRSEQYQLMPDLERVLSASRYLLDLIDDILALTLIEAGKMEVDPSAFQLGPVIRDVVAGIRPVAAKQYNRLIIDVDEVGSMYSDRSKIRQVVRNLVSNGAKFTTEGEVHVRAHREKSEAGDTVIIRVKDSGIGMTPEQVKLVFQAFVQADDSSTRRYQGSGLGLSICHLFCEMLEGSLEVESEVDEGTTFTVRLPAKLSL